MYQPSQTILKKYAQVLTRFALNSGKGIKKGEKVYLVTQLSGLPLAHEIYKDVLAMGAHPMVNVIDDNFRKIYLSDADEKQLAFFPKAFYKGLSDTIDHWIRILADDDPMLLKGVDPKKIMLANKSAKPFRDWLDEKEDKGKFTWTLCLYGTEGMAKEAGLSLKEYWNQIIKACYLRDKNPILKWQNTFKEIQRIQNKLNKLPIDKVHLEAKETDLWLTIGENRKWLGGSGRNIPSFEIFTSPDWRGTEGKVYFDLPLYRYGNIIKDIRLEFKKGKIVKATASKNEKLLQEMIAQKNADKVGEFSLTDKRFSKISSFMANTLYDENFGGNNGNTHIAVGKAYHDACSVPLNKMTKADFKKLGYNDSPEHTDIISSGSRKVTAYLKNGKSVVIYEKGIFQI